MKIACVDRTAADRIALQKLVDEAAVQCRESVGHFSFTHTSPVTREEIAVNTSYDAVIVGPGFGSEECFAFCREIRSKLPTTPLFLFLAPENYLLRNLRRFQKYCTDVFNSNESNLRFISQLCSCAAAVSGARQGKLLAVLGVKGGVGATSVVSGLAHAAHAVGKSAVVIDLSASGALIHYLAPPRWQSSDYAALLVDQLPANKNFVQRCLTTAPNGITALLPPAGGLELRELWLRNAQTFDVTLSIVDLLRDMYDVVIVDLAAAEGIVSYSLLSRSDTRLLVSSNDPASVHLLSSRLTEVANIPGASQIQILINQLSEHGLTRDDILDFLYAHEHFDERMFALDSLPLDARGRHWIGTGNSLYTESSSSLRDKLERMLRILTLDPNELRQHSCQKQGAFTAIGEALRRLIPHQSTLPPPNRALPFHGPQHPNQDLAGGNWSQQHISLAMSPSTLLRPPETRSKNGVVVSLREEDHSLTEDALYESPRAVTQ